MWCCVLAAGKKRCLILTECGNDINSMTDIGKFLTCYICCICVCVCACLCACMHACVNTYIWVCMHMLHVALCRYCINVSGVWCELCRCKYMCIYSYNHVWMQITRVLYAHMYTFSVVPDSWCNFLLNVCMHMVRLLPFWVLLLDASFSY